MLRCRRCRKGVVDSACLVTVEAAAATEESSRSACSIWHVSYDSLPEWIMTSVHQAQWTAGKLNCPTCGARVGGFNFLNGGKCPCGLDASVHLSKSRVESDHRPRVLIVQPARTRPQSDPLRASPSAPPASSFPLAHLDCTSRRRRRSREEDATSSCFCPAGLMDRSAGDSAGTGADGASFSPRRGLDKAEGGASGHAPVPRSLVPGQGRLCSVSPVDCACVPEDVRDARRFLGGRTASESLAEQDEATPVPGAPAASSDSSVRSKRERNRQKRLRRKQRRRERWLLSQLEPVIKTNVFAENRAHLASGGIEMEEEEGEDEGLTCGVCLEVYFSPYSCLPCGHVFCEPCLRTLAKNRVAVTPCPLCRTLISHTDFHKDLNQTAMTFFPKVYFAREQVFQSSSCSKWPLPNCSSGFRGFWGYQRQTSTSRSWHAAHGGFALDLTFMRRWLFDFCLFAGLVIVYDVNSAKWILALLFFCFLTYYFFF